MEQNKSRLRFLSQFHTFIHLTVFKFIHSVAGLKTLSFLVIIPTCITSRLSTLNLYTKFDKIIVPDIRISGEHKKIWCSFTFVIFFLGSIVIYGNNGFFVSPLPTSISSGRWLGFSNPLLQDVDVESLLRNSFVDVGTRW